LSYPAVFISDVQYVDDAFKLTVPLTNGMINEMLQQFAPLSDISQRSVATHFRCGGMLVIVLLKIVS